MSRGLLVSLRQRSFTIVGVLAAAGVMAFAITTSITVMQQSLPAVDTARNIGYASQFMQCELEKMRLRPWTTISGKQNIKACILTPNSTVTGDGGGNSGAFYGSFVAYTVTSNGRMDFHYDESLANISSGKPWALSLREELESSGDRLPYASTFNF